jgi:hypothetical protein
MKTEFLTKSQENLQAAQLLFDQGLYNASANRSYLLFGFSSGYSGIGRPWNSHHGT